MNNASQNQTPANADPHQGQPVHFAGEALPGARAAMLLVHGRGAGAGDMLGLAAEFTQPGLAFIAPQANANTWYPNRFTAPLQTNEPWLSSALAVIDGLTAQMTDPRGPAIPYEKIYLLGFSQGACLALEYAVRNPRRYGGIFGLSGGLIGPDEPPRQSTAAFAGTPVFLGCSDVDAHIPATRVAYTARTFEQMGAQVTTRFYPGMGHTVNAHEIEAVKKILSAA